MWDEIVRRIGQAGSWSPILDACPDDAGVQLERGRLEAGEPWYVAQLAGLQFYRYDQPDLNEEPLRPDPGERLNLVRRPDNPHDTNAVEVWLRNEHMLGHVARGLAARIAPALDRGVPLRCYALGPGMGEAWSVQALFVGRPMAEDHGFWLHHQVADAEWVVSCAKRHADAPHIRHGEAFARRQKDARQARLMQAVRAFEALPVDAGLVPPARKEGTARFLAARLGMSERLLARLVGESGAVFQIHMRGCYAKRPRSVLVTPELRAALLARCAAPTSRVQAKRLRAR